MLRRRVLSRRARGSLAMLRRRADAAGIVRFESARALAEALGLKRGQAARVMRELRCGGAVCCTSANAGAR